jgi:antitoxin component YwqK of YwqJK toxin-antitoxin module
MKSLLKYSWVFFLLLSCQRVEYDEIKQENCLIYHDDKPYSGSLIVRHENGEVQQKINVKDGQLTGDYEIFDYSGGKLSHGKIFRTKKKNIYIKKWTEGPGSLNEKSSVYYTILICDKNIEINSEDHLFIQMLADSLNVNYRKIGVLLSDKLLKSDQANYFDFESYLKKH